VFSFIKRHKLSFLTIIGLVVIIGGYFTFGRKTKESKIKLATVKKNTITETISASGTVDASKKTTLRFQTSGRLAWVGVKEGDYVKKGQALASLDKRELEKNLKKELNDYMNERWDFEQGREDYGVKYEQDQNYPSVLTDEIRRILQKNQFDLNNTVLDVQIKDLALKFATLTSPIDGIVIEIEQPYAGVNITPASAKFTVADPESVEFAAEVDEVDIGKIRQGQKSTITLDAYPDETFKSIVRQIDFNSIKTKGGGTAYLVKIDLPENLDQKFKLGMNGDVEIRVSEKKNTTTIPQKAITSKNGKTAVWVIDSKGNPKLKTIELGAETINKAEVKKGLKEGEKVVVEGFSELKEGKEIK
jgi:RND family efflux transporter MFP subunit